MASLFDRIATRLARVQQASHRGGSPVARSEPAERLSEPPSQPMTLESLEVALDKLAAARSEQMAIIYGAAAERDRVLDDPDGDDRELLAIQDRVGLAQLSVDRIARLEDEALEQLRPMREAKERAAWEAARDQFCHYARNYHAAMEALERSANQLWAVRHAVFSPLLLRDWEHQVPKLPRLMLYTPNGSVPTDSTTFAQHLERFSHISIHGPARAFRQADRLAAFIHGRADTASINHTAAFGAAAGVDEIEVLVRLSRDVAVEEGQVLRRGEVIRVSAEHACDLVAANRAILSDPTPHAGVGGAVRTLPLPHTVPLQQSQEI